MEPKPPWNKTVQVWRTVWIHGTTDCIWFKQQKEMDQKVMVHESTKPVGFSLHSLKQLSFRNRWFSTSTISESVFLHFGNTSTEMTGSHPSTACSSPHTRRRGSSHRGPPRGSSRARPPASDATGQCRWKNPCDSSSMRPGALWNQGQPGVPWVSHLILLPNSRMRRSSPRSRLVRGCPIINN